MDFSTVVGPQESIDFLISVWDRVTSDARLDSVAPPTVFPMPGYEYLISPRMPRAGVVLHAPGAAEQVAARLRDATARLGFSDLVFEPGFRYEYASPGRRQETSHPVNLRWAPERLAIALHPKEQRIPQKFVRRPHSGISRVAVIDTGDSMATEQIRIYAGYGAQEPCDTDGHGSAVGALIRMRAPGVHVTMYRVQSEQERSPRSDNVLFAMHNALYARPRFQLINVSLVAPVSTDMTRTLGESLEALLMQDDADRPTVVAAIGNGHGARATYPAILTNALPVAGLDWSGRAAPYNSRLDTMDIGYARGGIADDPLGFVWRGTQPAWTIFGSSMAAALVTGALAA